MNEQARDEFNWWLPIAVPQGQWLTVVLGVIAIVTAGGLRKKSSDARFVKWRLDWDLVSTYTGDPCLPTSRLNFVT